MGLPGKPGQSGKQQLSVLEFPRPSAGSALSSTDTLLSHSSLPGKCRHGDTRLGFASLAWRGRASLPSPRDWRDEGSSSKGPYAEFLKDWGLLMSRLISLRNGCWYRRLGASSCHLPKVTLLVSGRDQVQICGLQGPCSVNHACCLPAAEAGWMSCQILPVSCNLTL